MASTIARGPHSTEWCISVKEMDSDVVNEECSRRSVLLDLHQATIAPRILAEVVDSERLVKLVDKVSRLLNVLVRKDW